MLKKLYLIPVVSSMICLQTFANAKDGAYVSAFGGLGIATYSSGLKIEKLQVQGIKSQEHLGAAIGYNYHNYSFDFSYTNVYIKPKSYYNFYLVHAFYNINNLYDTIKPYLGIGFGYNSSRPSGDFSLLTPQLVAGSKFNINKHIQLFADYRYTVQLLLYPRVGLHSTNIGVSFLL